MIGARVNRLAVGSVVCALAGVVFGPLALIGVGLGVVAYERIPGSGTRGSLLALSGIGFGALAFLLNLFLVVLVIGG
ncbi:hypothetical protein A5630_16620 [Mycolicibacterium mucogenicum]|uniref:DUF4190 domain-containing protein n=1 Tax=Mycolicibacterium mucogenicum TaxID=56689 RepID=A0A1A3H9S2_MYCMU|nr:DUF4190 domain-containing protein [Mycolicibacterium mucogenicum]OBJ44336.1 hypothetical protein A5630_16620 [Mycolicibacterium mucogenicum]